MNRCIHPVLCTLALAMLPACESLPLPPVDGPRAHVSGNAMLDFRVRDDCDAVTFNQALGAGICKGEGGTTLEEFIEELVETQEVGSWDFNPENAKIRNGVGLAIDNEDGGETHTVTLVEAFAGGFIPDLNHLSGESAVAPECGAEHMPAPPSATNVIVDAGMQGSMSASVLPPGTHHLQCCIHPWMRSVITVE